MCSSDLIFQPHMEGTSVVVAQFRVPRIVLAVLCGMGLALAGCVMQTVTGLSLIHIFVGQLYEVFDLNSVEDAKEKYHSSPY